MLFRSKSGLDPLQTWALYLAWRAAGRERAVRAAIHTRGIEISFAGPLTLQAAMSAEGLGFTWRAGEPGTVVTLTVSGEDWVLPLDRPLVWPADHVLRGLRVRGPGRLESSSRVEFGFAAGEVA